MAELLTHIPATLGTFLAWWGRELAALVPNRLARIFRGPGGRLVVDLGDTEASVLFLTDGGETPLGIIDTGSQAAVQRKAFISLTRGLGRGTVVSSLRLPSDQALRKIMRLPLAAAENLRDVLGFEMDRQTPFKSEDVYFDSRIISLDADVQQMDVELTVVPRPVVEKALQVVSVFGLDPDRVDVSGGADDGRSPLDLRPPRTGPEQQFVSRAFSFLLGVVAVGLLAVAVSLPLIQRQQGLDALDESLKQARTEAKAATVLRQQIDRIVTDGRFLSDKRRSAPTVTRFLHELTTLLPDGSWVETVRINGGAVQITGFSDGASSLIGVLQGSPLFEEVKFRSPVTQDARLGVERFSISVRLVPIREGGREKDKNKTKEPGPKEPGPKEPGQ